MLEIQNTAVPAFNPEKGCGSRQEAAEKKAEEKRILAEKKAEERRVEAAKKAEAAGAQRVAASAPGRQSVQMGV